MAACASKETEAKLYFIIEFGYKKKLEKAEKSD